MTSQRENRMKRHPAAAGEINKPVCRTDTASASGGEDQKLAGWSILPE